MSSSSCPAIDDLVPASGNDQARASAAVARFLEFLRPRSYEPRAAWSMLDPFYIDRSGWQRPSDFAASDEGGPYGPAGSSVSKSADLVATVHGGSLTRDEYRDFLLARAGVVPSICSEPVREALGQAAWYVTRTPVHGNAPAYLLVLHRTAGYTVLASF